MKQAYTGKAEFTYSLFIILNAADIIPRKYSRDSTNSIT